MDQAVVLSISCEVRIVFIKLFCGRLAFLLVVYESASKVRKPLE